MDFTRTPPLLIPHTGLYDDVIVDSILSTVAASSAVLRAAAAGEASPGVIVLTGCGTSGRVAFLTARALNGALAAHGLPRVFRYLVSGGDHALLLSDELPEVSSWPGLRAVGRAGRLRVSERCMCVAFGCG